MDAKNQGIFLVPKYDSHILFPLVSFKKFKKLTVVLAIKIVVAVFLVLNQLIAKNSSF